MKQLCQWHGCHRHQHGCSEVAQGTAVLLTGCPAAQPCAPDAVPSLFGDVPAQSLLFPFRELLTSA